MGADITRRESLLSLHERVRAKLGEVDILVNNAAIDDKFESPGPPPSCPSSRTIPSSCGRNP